MKRRKQDGLFLFGLLCASAVPFVIALTSPEHDAYAARTAGSSSASAHASGSSSHRPPPAPHPSGSASSHFKK